jgi:hypothetical protein
MCVADPRECASDRANDEKVCDHTNDQDCVVVVLVVDKNVHDTEDQPQTAGSGAAGMNATEMLKCRSAAETENQRGPLTSFVSNVCAIRK